MMLSALAIAGCYGSRMFIGGDAGSDGHDAVPEQACPAGETLCLGWCVDRDTDPDHCGECGHACDEGFDCVAGVCTEPPVLCGNGVVDDGEECEGDSSRACTTTCGSIGTRACVSCAWDTECGPPVEICNGIDDDCDGLLDEVCGVPPGCSEPYTFATTSVPGGREAMRSDVADIDLDGHDDAVWLNQLDETATVFYGDGLGSSSEMRTYAVGRSEGYAAFGDVNGDGWNDMVVSNQDYGRVTLSLGTGPREFAPATYVEQDGFPQWVELLDADSDGDLDLLVQTIGLGCVTLRMNDGSGSFSPGGCLVPVIDPTSYFNSYMPSDIDVDGQVEIVTNAPGALEILELSIDGTSISARRDLPTPDFISGRIAFDIWDVDRDGDPDVYVWGDLSAGGGSGSMTYLNQGDGTFLVCDAVSGLPAGMGVAPSWGAAGDFDEDGLFDTTGQTTCSYCTSTYFVHLSV